MPPGEVEMFEPAILEPAIVEVWGQPAGIVLKEGQTYRFRAMDRAFQALDDTEHATLGHARLAAAGLHRAASASVRAC